MSTENNLSTPTMSTEECDLVPNTKDRLFKMQRFVNVTLITLGAITYLLTYFYRGSIAPITDVFETEFNATSSEVGFMSSVFWLSYFIVQIPCGIIIQFLKPEFILLISLILFTINTFLFSLHLIKIQ